MNDQSDQPAEVEHVVVTRRPPVGEVTLNRPEKKNSFPSFETLRPIREAFTALGRDEAVKVILFRGIGDTFSAGGDVSTIGHMYFDGGSPQRDDHGRLPRPSQRRHLKIDEDVYRAWEAIAECPKVVIAEGKGHVLGVALDWFLAADIAIASEETVFGYPPGRMIGYAGVNPLFQILRMGWQLHAEMTLMGRYIAAPEAEYRGMIGRVVPRDQLEETVEAAAEMVCQVPADGIVINKLSRRIALNGLGSKMSGLQSVLGHTLAVQLRLEDDDWSLMRERRDRGARGAWLDRDRRFRSAADIYEGKKRATGEHDGG